jgi:UDP-N-acetylglucosamine diphosphorylase/glucosamine-1-phosphate N-acetyltransferase
MTKTVFIFEDNHWQDFVPLTYSRPVCELLHGAFLLRERIARRFGCEKPVILCRPYVADVIREETGLPVNEIPPGTSEEESLFINGRLAEPEELDDRDLAHETAIVSGTDLVACRIAPEKLAGLAGVPFGGELFLGGLETVFAKKTKKRIPLCSSLWGLFLGNSQAIARDFGFYRPGISSEARVDSTARIVCPESVYVGQNVEVGPFAVIDASNGPIIVEQGVRIASFSYLGGPVWIGAGALVAGGKIAEGSSIGPVARVSGEIQNTIILGFSNKYHEGFLGHSYLGKWVNLGAGTTNSDLKNNYSQVSVQLGEQAIETGETKVGVFIGDHCKTGIGTLLNTGTALGFASNVFGGGMVSGKFVPSFSWMGGGISEVYKLNKCLETMKIVFSRRDIELTEAYATMVQWLFDLTEAERKSFGIV